MAINNADEVLDNIIEGKKHHDDDACYRQLTIISKNQNFFSEEVEKVSVTLANRNCISRTYYC
ncbi:MAG: hypothetical protein ACEY3J_01400 [Arsenophonus sp.]